MSIWLKRIGFSLRAAAEVFRATKRIGCDSPLVMMTRDDVQQQIDDLNHMAAEKGLLYQVIDHMVAGGSPCVWCREYSDCEFSDKGGSTPDCGLWDLFDIVREEAATDEPAAATAEAESNP